MSGGAQCSWFLLTVSFLLAPHWAQSQVSLSNLPPAQSSTAKAEISPVREPAVAGLFYPKDPAELARLIDSQLAKASPEKFADLKAIVCPHAGYEFSGPTAAWAYKTLLGRRFETVVILAPSHYALFTGASVPAVAGYRTPLGIVSLSPKASALAKTSPCVSEPRCLVQRPGWWRQSSRGDPGPGNDTPDTWEHSAEVQVPFLQRVLTNFNLLPVVLGEVDPAQVAHAVARQLDDKTLIVVSSDLSHYHPYAEARELDQRSVKAICAVDIPAMKNQEACGKLPILALLYLAHEKGWRARLLDYRNSGDTAGDKAGVVGYSAIAFFAPPQQSFNASERKQLLILARRALKEAVSRSSPGAVKTNGWPAKFLESRGCFVTLTKAGELRGCIGHIFPQEPLAQAIQDNAQNAAIRDPRFPPIRQDELDQLEVEISVLSQPEPLAFNSPEDLLAKLQPGQDGVVLNVNGHTATFLPQVWEQLPEKVSFLNRLSQKAGGTPDDWRREGTQVLTYRVESFKDREK